MAWTDAQQQAIDKRQSNILVSAAAGSGKTAVLVERIINKITDKNSPRDIDEFLVVTFTKAAAAQMKEKIAAKLEALLEDNPDDDHLIRQLVLINRANIQTIDSFCLSLVKENFGLLGIDAAFGIGDSGIMALMKNDILDEMFEELYNEKNEDFFNLLDIFGNVRNDDNLKNNIFNIYRVASSYPRPYDWFENAKKALEIHDRESLYETEWFKAFLELVKAYTYNALESAREGLNICDMAGGPDKNHAVAEADIEALTKIYEAQNYDELSAAIKFSWMKLKTCKGDAYDEELVELYKENRNSYKDIIKRLKLAENNSDEIVEEIKNMSEYLIPLLNLVIDFSRRYDEEKDKRKLYDFSDVEHMAYRLVCAGYDDDGKPVSTKLGEKISEKYNEIFIDEYQDSNFLQEDILYSVSGIKNNRYNMFMVGDVKQSIYRFRMARPDLFISKYNTFKSEGNEIKIELKNNFRSRDNVLNTINYFFYQLMGADLGGIPYNESVALVPTKEFPPCDKEISENVDKTTEILFIDSFDTEDKKTNIELEAYAIANRIKELLDKNSPQYVYDEEKGRYRKASYKDIVILSRNIKGFGETVYNVLSMAGIPAYLEDTSGYFDAVEIRTIMSLLSVVDNIRQDIPLSAVLLSPLAEISENELALIADYASKKLKEKHDLYEKCICYMEDADDYISDKLKRIFDIINTLKEDNKVMSIASLIWKALDMTNYYNYAMAMPMGHRRKANINMLIEKAHSFENGAYKGLFNFLRYVDKLKINEVDFGEASILSDDEDVVRIISIHKSKGLEYPIVFASGFGKKMNNNELREQLIVHSDYYLASYYINHESRYKKNTFMREVFKLLIKKENVAEELRVLYVALTRAKEKLIITGCDKNLSEFSEKRTVYNSSADDRLLPFEKRFDAGNYLKWILYAMTDYESYREECDICMHILSEEDVNAYMDVSAVKNTYSIYDFYDKALSSEKDVLYNSFKSCFEMVYPYQHYVDIRSKMSISDIKKMKAYDGENYDVNEKYVLPDTDETETNSNKEYMAEADTKKKITGARRGTIIHKFMELLDFKPVKDIIKSGNSDKELINYIRSFLKKIVVENLFDEDEASVINPYKISAMLMSDLGRRMIDADIRGRLKKEQQFSAGIPADKLFERQDKIQYSYDDMVIVQGIIDAYFIEDDRIILMDYKTDYADADELIRRYKAQLDYYSYVLEQITGLKVTEKIIYSFYLEKDINID
ncbi:MAG: helicase-exonuclease AddAB subunit AddA [Lachnospiraceae bacterium]|nr:helicase-exonuclease AddAB subunit AddA [Lachnospiraceae bacterium]